MEDEHLAKKGETKTRPGKIPTFNLRTMSGDAMKNFRRNFSAVEYGNSTTMKKQEIGGVYSIVLKLVELERRSKMVV